MNLRHTLRTSLAAGAAVALLVGCGSTAPAGTSAASTGTSGSTTSLVAGTAGITATEALAANEEAHTADDPGAYGDGDTGTGTGTGTTITLDDAASAVDGDGGVGRASGEHQRRHGQGGRDDAGEGRAYEHRGSLLVRVVEPGWD